MEKRRHVVLINRTFQFKLIAKFILVNILITLLFCFFVYIFFNSEIEANLQTAHVTYTNIKNMLLPIVVAISVINILISSIIIFIFVLFASHKIAGPMFRFNKALKQISNGNFKTLTSIREDDQLYECSATLKDMVNVLSDDMNHIKAKVYEIDSIAKKTNAASQIKDIIKQIEEVINRYNLVE